MATAVCACHVHSNLPCGNLVPFLFAVDDPTPSTNRIDYAQLEMDVFKLPSMIEQLDDNLDDLEDALKPLLDAPVFETANKLPLLDKSKLYVLTTYSIESLIFCMLSKTGLQDVCAKIYKLLCESMASTPKNIPSSAS